jgi:hypothetical protein
MRVNKCDRCLREVGGLWVVTIDVVVGSPEAQYKPIEKAELCESCKDALQDWVKRGAAHAA